MVWKATSLVLFVASALWAGALAAETFQSGENLVSSVMLNCVDMDCVKENVLNYLDTFLNKNVDRSRTLKNIDALIYKRVAKILKTHEIRLALPEGLFDKSELIYNPKTGLDVVEKPGEEQGRGLLKKKLFLPILLLLKLKLKALTPILLALVGLKALKALILSKLAIAIVLGFVIYQFVNKSGMPMPMTLAPAVDPGAMYGAPAPSTPSSYEPGWEPNAGGPYSRVWNANEPQSLSYSAYYPGSASSSTNRP